MKDMKDNERYEIKWEIIEKSRPFTVENDYCRLFVTEKFYILNNKKPSMLNNFRIEQCRHKDGAYLDFG